MNKDATKIKKKSKLKIRPWMWVVIAIVCLCGASYSGYKIYEWNKHSSAIETILEDIENAAVVEEIEEGEAINPPEEGSTTNNDYWDFIKKPLISVDFTELKERNSDTVAFIRVNGTNINYPVVQAADNDYYLTHAFDKSYNTGGWVFLDYRNNMDNLSDNTIIYGHGRQNKTIFGDLKAVVNKSWYENSENHTIYVSTPTNNTLWQVFSVYTIPTETYYLISKFGSNESHQKYIDTMVSRSIYNFNTDVNINDKLLTLSTCWNHDIKVVVHAKLIKKQNR